MSQATQVLIGTVLGFSAIGVLLLIRVLGGGADDEPAPSGPVTQAYRYCPTELRTRAAVVHGDGTATCSNCHTHIPARTEEVPHV